MSPDPQLLMQWQMHASVNANLNGEWMQLLSADSNFHQQTCWSHAHVSSPSVVSAQDWSQHTSTILAVNIALHGRDYSEHEDVRVEAVRWFLHKWKTMPSLTIPAAPKVSEVWMIPQSLVPKAEVLPQQEWVPICLRYNYTNTDNNNYGATKADAQCWVVTVWGWKSFRESWALRRIINCREVSLRILNGGEGQSKAKMLKQLHDGKGILHLQEEYWK